MTNYNNETTNNETEGKGKVMKCIDFLTIEDDYGNVFDIKDSILNTATLDSAFISFYNTELDYIFEYFFDDDRIWLEGNFDEDYWTDERVEEITEKMKKTNNDNLNKNRCECCRYFIPVDVDLDTAMSIMFEEMRKYSIYKENNK